ncbi:MAG: GNAT family N-acetyltransferase [Defluviitaleaceae bacterium]|nr:GNAT family N-acetyltransferase [Defluviitaleaceae bacterium]
MPLPMRTVSEYRVLYAMCYDIVAHEHFVYHAYSSIALACQNMPVWLWISQGLHKEKVRQFFNEFLEKYDSPLVGLVAEEKFALDFANMYSSEFTHKEIIAYSLPNEVPIVTSDEVQLRLALPHDTPLVLQWLGAFYEETLQAQLPSVGDSKVRVNRPPKIYILSDSQYTPLGMGMLTNTEEAGRINLVYILPQYRRNGYGKALVSALAQKARDARQVPVLYTASDNVAANALYTGLGFAEAGRLTEVRFAEVVT